MFEPSVAETMTDATPFFNAATLPLFTLTISLSIDCQDRFCSVASDGLIVAVMVFCSPTFIVRLFSFKVMEVTYLMTETSQEAERLVPSVVVAVITTVPVSKPSTLPFLST